MQGMSSGSPRRRKSWKGKTNEKRQGVMPSISVEDFIEETMRAPQRQRALCRGDFKEYLQLGGSLMPRVELQERVNL